LDGIQLEDAGCSTSLQRALMRVEDIAQRQAVVLQPVAVYFAERRFRAWAKRSTPLSITCADLPVAKRPARLLRSTVTAPDLLLMVTVVTPA
jgi:hypothetical protein